MNAYNPTSFGKKIAIAAVTFVVGAGVLEVVAGAMMHPDPGAMATRQRVIAMEADRAHQIRALERGEIRYADSSSARTAP